MCLLFFSADGSLMPREAFDTARTVNPDGIGIFSTEGTVRYIGKRSARKAWRELRRLANAGVPYGAFFRWRTHGAVSQENVHPFVTADARALVAHNGVIALTAKDATSHASDTALYVSRYMCDTPAPDEPDYDGWLARVKREIGYGNKLLVLHDTGDFTIVNESAGFWNGEHWYSNTYSVPDSVLPSSLAPVYLCDSEMETTFDWPPIYTRFYETA
jgi:predicted glutamine amidotransferase